MFDPVTLRFTYVNEGAQQQIGCSEADMKKMSIADIVSGFSLEKYHKVAVRLRECLREVDTLSRQDV